MYRSLRVLADISRQEEIRGIGELRGDRDTGKFITSHACKPQLYHDDEKLDELYSVSNTVSIWF